MKLKQPYLDWLPPLKTEEREALKASIEKYGVLDPVVVDTEGNVLDGHHRLSICPDAPTRTVKALSPAECKAFVFHANMTRRNLSPSQLPEYRERMKAIAFELREEGKTQQEIATALGVDRATVSRWTDIPNVQTHERNTGAALGRKRTAEEIEANRKIGKAVREAAEVRGRRDCRIKIPKAEHERIAERVAKKREPQAQVAADYGVGQAQISKIVSSVERKQQQETAKPKELPKGKHDVIVADPPWQYDFAETDSRNLDNQYPTMTVDEICEMDVASFANKDCVLFMWATAPKLTEAMRVIDEWGFTYKTHGIWDKQKIGMGYWFRGRHELLMVATRGNPSPPPPSARIASVFCEPRGRHSAKPEAAWQIIESMTASALRRLELFSRNPRKGWSAWGNEAQ